MIKVVNRELRSVTKLLDVNNLSLNIDKTNYIIFHSSSVSIPSDAIIKIGKKHIKRVKFVKFLGLLLDEHLSWKYHLSELSKKLARTCGIFFKIRNLLPLDVLLMAEFTDFHLGMVDNIAIIEMRSHIEFVQLISRVTW